MRKRSKPKRIYGKYKTSSSRNKKLFDIDADEVKDSVIPLDDLARSNLTEQLLNARDIFVAIEIITDFLILRTNQSRFTGLLIEQSIKSILSNITSTSSMELAKEVHLFAKAIPKKV